MSQSSTIQDRYRAFKRILLRWREALVSHDHSVSKKVRSLAVFLYISGLALRLPFAASPPAVAFDEVHYGKHLTAYCCTRIYFNDPHPPHAKLILGSLATLGGYEGRSAFKHVGEPLSKGAIRTRSLVSAVSALIPPAAMGVAYLLSGSIGVGAFTGVAFLFESSIWLESRLFLLDGFLVLFNLFSLLFALLAATTHPFERPWLRRVFLSCCGIAIGFTVGTKITGLAVVPAVLLTIWGPFSLGPRLAKGNVESILESRPWKQKWLARLRDFIWLGACGTFTYLAGWGLHLALLRNPDSSGILFALRGDFWDDLVRAHRSMMQFHFNLTSAHVMASPWWSWIVGMKPMPYWSSGTQIVVLAGNPILMWGGLSCLIAAFTIRVLGKFSVSRIASSARLVSWRPGLRISFFAFITSYFPYALISRHMFFYHYLPGLAWLIIFSAQWLKEIGIFAGEPMPWEAGVVRRISLWILGGFVLVFPYVSGVPFGRLMFELLKFIYPLLEKNL